MNKKPYLNPDHFLNVTIPNNPINRWLNFVDLVDEYIEDEAETLLSGGGGVGEGLEGVIYSGPTGEIVYTREAGIERYLNEEVELLTIAIKPSTFKGILELTSGAGPESESVDNLNRLIGVMFNPRRIEAIRDLELPVIVTGTKIKHGAGTIWITYVGYVLTRKAWGLEEDEYED